MRLFVAIRPPDAIVAAVAAALSAGVPGVAGVPEGLEWVDRRRWVVGDLRVLADRSSPRETRLEDLGVITLG